MENQTRREIWRMVKFTLFSASAGLIEMGVFAVLYQWIGWRYWPSYLIALTASVLWNFTLNRQFTFRAAGNVPVAMAKVAAYYAVFTPLSTWGGHFLSDTLLWNGFLVTALNMVLNFVTEYLYQRFVVFGKDLRTPPQAGDAPTADTDE